MVSTLCYIILPVVIIAGLLRKCREYSWGRCKSKSNLEGRVFIITGANSGIGKEVAKELAKRKATVILACRNLQAAKATVQEIRNYALGAELVNNFILMRIYFIKVFILNFLIYLGSYGARSCLVNINKAFCYRSIEKFSRNTCVN